MSDEANRWDEFTTEELNALDNRAPGDMRIVFSLRDEINRRKGTFVGGLGGRRGPSVGQAAAVPRYGEENRQRAIDNLRVIVERVEVTPRTLAKYANATGCYSKAPTSRPHRSDAKMPERFSPEGEHLAREVMDACGTYRPSWIAELIESGR